MTPMNLRGVGYVGLDVPDVAAWTDFATGVIGLMPVDPPAGGDAAGDAYFTSDDRQWRVALHRSDRAQLAYAGFEVLDEPSFHEAVAHLESQGAGPKPATDDELAARGVRAMVHVQDPSGTRIEIFWGPVVTGRFCSPVGVPRFVTENGSVHYVLLVSDLGASMDFYLRVLGMKLTDYCDIGPGMSVQFLRCTPRHHSVALTAVGPMQGLHHVAFEVPDIDHVGMALERATRAGIPITATLGRHKNDHMLSFYMRSPAGFEIEVGCGARLVDDATWVTNRFAEGDLWGHHGLTGDAMAEAVAETAG
jgi:3,4-dihydroxy-9,10-secoandrosta-1,3,5(10)-triene-9,17-dione 4,5-dioxygenase